MSLARHINQWIIGLTLRVLDNLGSLTLHYSYSRVGGTCLDVYMSMRPISKIATREDIPKSIPMTGPLTFDSLSSRRTKEELNGLLERRAERVTEDVARGSC
jgi:hypothetical protein